MADDTPKQKPPEKSPEQLKAEQQRMAEESKQKEEQRRAEQAKAQEQANKAPPRPANPPSPTNSPPGRSATTSGTASTGAPTNRRSAAPTVQTNAPGTGIDSQIADKERELEVLRKRKEAHENLDVNSLATDLAHGEAGYIVLSEDGTPTGPATKEPPDPGQVAARVVGYKPAPAAEAVTPSGAPITPQMNPNPDLWDAGMLKRNPPDGSTQEPENPDKGGNAPKSSLGTLEGVEKPPTDQTAAGSVKNSPVSG